MLFAFVANFIVAQFKPKGIQSGDNVFALFAQQPWAGYGLGAGQATGWGRRRLVSHKLPQNNPNYQQNSDKYKCCTWC